VRIVPRNKPADSAKRIEEILAATKALAVEYYQLTGKPLGVTDEVAEYACRTATPAVSWRRGPSRSDFRRELADELLRRSALQIRGELDAAILVGWFNAG
jgi:hypothetical protein